MKLCDILAKTSWMDILDAFSTYYPESVESLPFIRRAFMNLLSIHPGHSESILTYLPFFTGDGFVYIQLAAIGGKAGRDPLWGLAMTSWKEWLAMEVDDDILRAAGAPRIVADCLLEMTTLGAEQEDVDHKIKEVRKALRAADLRNRGRNDLMWGRIDPEDLDE